MSVVNCLSSLEFWKLRNIGINWSMDYVSAFRHVVIFFFFLHRVPFNKRSVSGCNSSQSNLSQASVTSDILSGDDVDSSLNAQNARIAERRSNSNTDIQSRFTLRMLAAAFCKASFTTFTVSLEDRDGTFHTYIYIQGSKRNGARYNTSCSLSNTLKNFEKVKWKVKVRQAFSCSQYPCVVISVCLLMYATQIYPDLFRKYWADRCISGNRPI